MLMDLGFTLENIKDLTTLQVQMYLQRSQEPIYKQEIDAEIMKAKN